MYSILHRTRNKKVFGNKYKIFIQSSLPTCDRTREAPYRAYFGQTRQDDDFTSQSSFLHRSWRRIIKCDMPSSIFNLHACVNRERESRLPIQPNNIDTKWKCNWTTTNTQQTPLSTMDMERRQISFQFSRSNKKWKFLEFLLLVGALLRYIIQTLHTGDRRIDGWRHYTRAATRFFFT